MNNLYIYHESLFSIEGSAYLLLVIREGAKYRLSIDRSIDVAFASPSRGNPKSVERRDRAVQSKHLGRAPQNAIVVVGLCAQGNPSYRPPPVNGVAASKIVAAKGDGTEKDGTGVEAKENGTRGGQGRIADALNPGANLRDGSDKWPSGGPFAGVHVLTS